MAVLERVEARRRLVHERAEVERRVQHIGLPIRRRTERVLGPPGAGSGSGRGGHRGGDRGRLRVPATLQLQALAERSRAADGTSALERSHHPLRSQEQRAQVDVRDVERCEAKRGRCIVFHALEML